MSIFRASINMATASRTREELNDHVGTPATRWSGIGDPIHDFDPDGPAREISQWHLDSGVAEETQLLEPHLGPLRPALERLAASPCDGVLYSSFSIGVTGRENGFVFEIEPADAALIARAGLHLRVDAYAPGE
ncbi:MAG: hypothetical protein JWM50_2493 [Microbacteriaceae bacterium]|jgi:hypothetical protein|nr:hypothetical protein [Microbacteriaceae bacterium]